ncbi:hypothetical protein BDY21DRAFT_35664 [Lineolata rhizophorae]|uniref:Secreted protein n=1 Tax=Lineolata rhizophorae TaxID=578093 RepID=A0A6A6P038_9PEZI|nr:hypothetical protein BDY21DRAFT_35664 [Lineolata rhizophorae]
MRWHRRLVAWFMLRSGWFLRGSVVSLFASRRGDGNSEPHQKSFGGIYGAHADILHEVKALITSSFVAACLLGPRIDGTVHSLS